MRELSWKQFCDQLGHSESSIQLQAEELFWQHVAKQAYVSAIQALDEVLQLLEGAEFSRQMRRLAVEKYEQLLDFLPLYEGSLPMLAEMGLDKNAKFLEVCAYLRKY